MKRLQKKGFTITELVIVIAVVAILAAVLIPTFASIIKKANDSAYLQERTSQQIADLAEKVENQNYLSWEDFEAELAKYLADLGTDKGDALTADDVEKAIADALAVYADKDTGLTEDQIKKIVEESVSKGQLTTAQVKAIVDAAIRGLGTSGSSITTAQVEQIVNQAMTALKNSIGNTAISKEQMEAAINTAIQAALAANGETLSADEIKAVIEQAIKAFGDNELTPEKLQELLDNAVAVEVEFPAGVSAKQAIIDAIKNAPDGAVLKLPENTNLQMAKGGMYWLGQALNQGGGTAKHITIDLNGNTLSSTGSNAVFVRTEDDSAWLTNGGSYVYNILEVPVNGELVLKNGAIDIQHGNQPALAAFIAHTGSTLKLKNMTVNTSTAGILPAGDASEVVIEDSTINALNYALATNRAESNRIRIVIDNSDLSVTHSTAVMINTSADAHIYNSTITGVVHGVFLRAGTLEIKDSTIITNDTAPGIYSANDFASGYGFLGFWGTGNTAPAGTIVVGDYTKPNPDGSFAYSGDSVLTLYNTTLQSASGDAMPEILLAAYDPDKTASVSYNGTCNVGDIVVYGTNWAGTDDNVGLSFSHEGNIVVNGSANSVSTFHIPTWVGTFAAGEYAVSALNVNDPAVAGYDYNATVRAQIQTAWGLTLTDKEWASVTMNFSSATANQLKTISYTKEDGTAASYGPSRIDLTGLGDLGLLNSNSVSVLKKSANCLDVFKEYCKAEGINLTDASKFVIGTTTNVIIAVK